VRRKVLAVATSNQLTAIQVAKLRAPGRYADGGGLYLQVSKAQRARSGSGAAGGNDVTKSWLFRFERGGRERQMGLGPITIVSLADARERARAARRLLLDGHDPIEARQRERDALRLAAAKAMTFAECADAFITAHAPGWRNEKHAAQWRATLKTYAEPLLGGLPVAEVDTSLLLKVLEPI
jgi:hypothetical protein